MNLRLLVPFGVLLAGTVCWVASLVLLSEVVEAVNERLPERQQYSLFVWQTKKQQELYARYRELCPDGRSHRRIGYLVRTSWVLLAAATFLFWKTWL